MCYHEEPRCTWRCRKEANSFIACVDVARLGILAKKSGQHSPMDDLETDDDDEYAFHWPPEDEED